MGEKGGGGGTRGGRGQEIREEGGGEGAGAEAEVRGRWWGRGVRSAGWVVPSSSLARLIPPLALPLFPLFPPFAFRMTCERSATLPPPSLLHRGARVVVLGGSGSVGARGL